MSLLREPGDPVVALPAPRGPLSASILRVLLGGGPPASDAFARIVATTTGIGDDDLQLGLYLCYELHYGGLPGVDSRLEWDPSLLALRRILEARFESDVRALVPPTPQVPVDALVPALIEAVGGRSVSSFVEASATSEQLREFVLLRSAYQLKEADPHTWAVPRLSGVAKRTLLEIQVGEYGLEDAGHVSHAELFADAMRALHLDARHGAHLDRLPGVSLAVSNLASMLGLHRRLRAALAGHLALSELTSVEAMRRYVRGFRRLGAPAEARHFYEVHVLADAVHERMVITMLKGLLADEPDQFDEIAFGIAASLVVEREFADYVLSRWACGEPAV